MADLPVSVDLAVKLVEVDAALQGSGVGYAFGGAIALAYHVGQPRGTADLDVNLATSAGTVAPVLDLLPDIEWDERTLAHLEDEGWVRLWLEGDIPLDLFVPQHQFHVDLQAHTETVPFRDRTIPIVSATHLTVLKAMFSRSKDWADIEAMLLAGSVDVAVATQWTEELLGPDHPSHVRLVQMAGPVGSS